jgi:signal peptide peptidase SppA
MNTYHALIGGAAVAAAAYMRPKTSKKAIVAAVNLYGDIGSPSSANLSVMTMKSAIHKAFTTPGVKAVAFRLNSPGGSPFHSEELFTYIRLKAEEFKVPVHMFIEDVGASGGYYIACAGDSIYASTHSVVGSIGVISEGFVLKNLIEKIGIKHYIFAQGKNKAGITPFTEPDPVEIENLTTIQKQIHEEFMDVVKKRRGEKLMKVDGELHPDLFTGKVWAGKDALTMGLIDGIGSYYPVLLKMYGDSLEIKEIKTEGSLKDMLRKLISEISVNALKPYISSSALPMCRANF